MCNSCRLASFSAFTINALTPGYSYMGPDAGTIDASNMCKCNTITYSLISACDACQGAEWTRYDYSHRCYLLDIRENLHISTLAGRNFRIIAQRLCRPQREPHPRRKLYCIGTDKGQTTHSFPNPIPSGTRVPKWALLDITVRCYVFFDGNMFTEPPSGSLRIIGTLTSLLQSVVRTLSLPFSHYQCLTPTPCFLDTPEELPGVLLGPSGASTVSASGTRSGATSAFPSESSSGRATVVPTPTSTSNSSSNTGAIVGGVVGGVAVISIAAVAIGFFLRRRRPETGPAVTQPAFGAPQPHMDEIQQPLTMDDSYTASSIPGTIGSSIPGTPGAPMRIYVRVSYSVTRCASSCAHRIQLPYPFDTQDPNDPATYPGYQGVPQTPISPPQGSFYQGSPQTPNSPPQGAAPSFNGAGNSLATMQTSRPQGYHGLPTV